MNILINSYCNLKCPYCFADDTMTDDCTGHINMTEKDFITCMNYNKIVGSRQLRIIGGEPTIAPNFLRFVELGVNDNFFEEILIFSNFTFDREISNRLLELGKLKKISFLPNINSFNLLIPKYKDNILYNLNFLSSMVTSIGINLYDPNADISQWELLIATNRNIRHLRYSIAVPSKKTLENNFNFYEYYHSFQGLLLQLSNLCVKYGITVGCDCNNVPPCCLDSEALMEIFKRSASDILCDRLNCGYPVFDVDPDLTVVPCFGTSSALLNKRKLTDFLTKDEIYDYFDTEGKKHLSKIARKECLSCNRYKITGMSCGCRSCHLIDINEVSKQDE